MGGEQSGRMSEPRSLPTAATETRNTWQINVLLQAQTADVTEACRAIVDQGLGHGEILRTGLARLRFNVEATGYPSAYRIALGKLEDVIGDASAQLVGVTVVHVAQTADMASSFDQAHRDGDGSSPPVDGAGRVASGP